MSEPRTTLISGWGRTPTIAASITQPATWHEARNSISASTWIARGLGRSYGDPAVPTYAGGRVVLGTGLDRFMSFNEETGDLTAEAGVTLEDIIETFQPKGWFLPTTPGTKFVTLGGAVAADVHGKNHHVDGSFCAHVKEITILTSNGRFHSLSPERNPRWFWATAGGMGLTGLIMSVTVRLRRVPSAWYQVRYERTKNLETALLRMAETNHQYRYSVAWIDCLASGRNLGRSILMLGNDAQPDELPPASRQNPMCFPRKNKKDIPINFPCWALGPWSVSAFNQAFYLKHSNRETILDFDSYFYPLDAIHFWNRIYGKRGFVQFQALFPDSTAAMGLRLVLEALSETRLASFLAILKRSGEAGAGLLSYLFPGYTLALDIPNVGHDLIALHKRLELILLKLGGRIYFAKDALAAQETISSMYPRLEEFRKIQLEMDPGRHIRSRLGERLGLIERFH